MNSVKKEEMREKLEEVTTRRLEHPSDNCHLKKALGRALDPFVIVHPRECAKCIAEDVINFLNKEKLI
jgi:hypothetical protein